MSKKKASEFFKSHPEINTVYSALGVLFVEVEKANNYVAGTNQGVETYNREVDEKPNPVIPFVTDETSIFADENPDLSFDADKAIMQVDEQEDELPPAIAAEVPAQKKVTTGKKRS